VNGINVTAFKLAMARVITVRRMELYITRPQLAVLLSITPGHMARIESGEHEVTTAELLAIATALRLSANQLLTTTLHRYLHVMGSARRTQAG